MRRLLLESLMVVAMVVGAASVAAAHPIENGCPPGWQLWDVDHDGPWMADGWTDEDGNQDGYVCAKPYKGPMGKNTFDVYDDEGDYVSGPHQVYWFRDNVVPGGSR